MRTWNEKRARRAKEKIANNNPVVRFLFEEMYKQQIHYADMSERMGYHQDTIRKWRSDYCPRLNDIMDCLDYLGYDLVVARKSRKGRQDE